MGWDGGGGGPRYGGMSTAPRVRGRGSGSASAGGGGGQGRGWYGRWGPGQQRVWSAGAVRQHGSEGAGGGLGHPWDLGAQRLEDRGQEGRHASHADVPTQSACPPPRNWIGGPLEAGEGRGGSEHIRGMALSRASRGGRGVRKYRCPADWRRGQGTARGARRQCLRGRWPSPSVPECGRDKDDGGGPDGRRNRSARPFEGKIGAAHTRGNPGASGRGGVKGGGCVPQRQTAPRRLNRRLTRG
jgi:hypothetical protein